MKRSGKTAIITGGARGIGAAIAATTVREGARVCVADIEFDAATATAAHIGGASFAVHLDVTKRQPFAACVKAVEGTAGGVDDGLFAKYENRPSGETKRLVGEAVPHGHMGIPQDVAGCAVFLASNDSDYVVAQTFNVDGGQWMS
jgi:NAD(P)-dependent dehydrogenase (short-subunit alcohol dehydrogenase family)